MFPSTFLTTLNEQSPFKLLVQLSIPDGKTLKSGYISISSLYLEVTVISTLRTPHALSFSISRIENTLSDAKEDRKHVDVDVWVLRCFR